MHEMVYRRRWHTNEEGAVGRRTRGSSSFAGLGRFRRAGRAGRPAAPRIKTGGRIDTGARTSGTAAWRGAKEPRSGGLRRGKHGSMHGRDVDAMEAELCPESARAGGVRFPRTCVCDESREIVGMVARVGFSDVAKGDEGTTRGGRGAPHSGTTASSFFEALPNRMRTRRSPLHSEEKKCWREKPHACGGAEAVCEVGEGGEKGEGEAVNEQTFSLPAVSNLPLFVCLFCFPL